jgi:hypothetical protein
MAKETVPDYFDKPELIRSLLETMQTVENVRAQERAWVDILMNGRRPYTEAEVKSHQIRINVNWNEGNNILQDANRQVNNATLYVARFFNATYLDGPPEFREEIGQKFTTIANRMLKKGPCGRRHMFIRKTRNASVCLHGPGPLMWMKKSDLLPRFIPLEDLLIPTDTNTDLYNLQQFGVNLYLTQGEFYDLTHSPNVDKGWDVKFVEKILDALKDPASNNTYDLNQQPEKWQEIWKQNKCYYNSDAVPRVKLRLFVFQAPDQKWYRRIVLRENPSTKAQFQMSEAECNKFVYTSNVPFANDISEILHVQYGDCSIVPPLKFHSVRGLGTLLYGPVEMSNRLKCQFVQAAFDNLMQLLRVENPDDRIRQQIVQLFPYATVEKGVSFVKNDERHVPDVNFAQSAMSLTRQNMSENSASFVQDINDGTNKEMTLGEAEIRANAANVMVGGMLQSMYAQDEPYFEELVRRLCMTNPTDPFIKEFQEECKKAGLPQECYTSAEHWDISIERVIGAGDQVLAQQRASALLGQVQRYDPTSQRKIVKLWTTVMTDNPDLASDLVPMKEPEATDGTQTAETLFGTLMEGVPVSVVEGIDQMGYIESMIGNMSSKIGKIEELEQQGQYPDLEELQGLDTVQQDIWKHIEIVEQNPENKQMVKAYGDALGQLNNMLKKFIQHYMERMQEEAENQNVDQEAMAKANATTMLAQVKAQISEQNAAQKRQHSALKFQQQLEQKMVSGMQRMKQDQDNHMLDMQKQLAELRAQLASKAATTAADVAATKAKADAAPKATKE